LSSRAAATPAAQQACEHALLEAAARGEAHLHVSSLDGEVLSLGAFHREPSGPSPPLRWRRLTGGRAAAAGSGLRVLTLALPHRAALVAARAGDLRPEQALNRCVRGLLAALERLGVQPIYPGLDLVTAGGRGLALLGLAERRDGAALFQALIAWQDSFARTPELLDRADPQGRIPMTLAAAASFTRVVEVSPEAERQAGPLPALAQVLAAGYQAAFGTEIVPAPAPEGGSGTAVVPGATPLAGIEPVEGAREATVTGRLGPITGWLATQAERITAAGVSGDFLAPLDLPAELGERLSGRPATREAIGAALRGWLDGRDRYLLGLREPELADLLAATAANPAVHRSGPA
jgi:hypothetical protein